MEQQIDRAVRSLEKLLLEQKDLTEQLIVCGEQTEAALVKNDLNDLKEIVEHEEDLTIQFGEKERARIQQVRTLLVLLSVPNQNASLKEIGSCLPDSDAAARLCGVGDALGKSVVRLQKKSRSLKELLTLKSDYTDMMLRLLTGSDDCRSQSYNGRGDRTKPYDGNNGIYEVLV